MKTLISIILLLLGTLAFSQDTVIYSQIKVTEYGAVSIEDHYVWTVGGDDSEYIQNIIDIYKYVDITDCILFIDETIHITMDHQVINVSGATIISDNISIFEFAGDLEYSTIIAEDVKYYTIKEWKLMNYEN